MLVQYIQKSQNQIGKPIPKGTVTHITNEAAKELIEQGIVKSIEDPENYAPYSEETSHESSTDENETDNKPATAKKKRKKKQVN